MAKIVEERVIIKISKLVRDQDEGTTILNTAVISGIDTIISELIGDPSAVVEIDVED